MGHRGLDLSTLRRYIRNQPLPQHSPDLSSPSSIQDRSISRRGLLGFAAFAGFGLAPTLKIADMLLELSQKPFDYEATPTRVAFKLHGKERWVIDCGRFGGDPRLIFRRNGETIHLELIDARFPGTDLPADFICDISRRNLSWQMDLQCLLGGFKTSVPFVQWLSGAAPARSRILLDHYAYPKDYHQTLHLRGAGTGDFNPEWTFSFTGSRIVRLRSTEAAAMSDRVTVTLLGTDAPSLLDSPPKNRTLVAFERGAYTWRTTPNFNCQGQGCLSASDNSFSSLRIETWQDQDSGWGMALLAEAGSAASTMPAFETHGSGPMPLSKSVRFSLVRARYARLLEPSTGQREQALVGLFPAEPMWVDAHGCQLGIGDSPSTPSFEIAQQGDDAASVRCEPGLLYAHVPLDGAVVEPLHLPYGARLRLVQTSPVQKPQQRFRAPSLPTVPKAQSSSQAPPLQQFPSSRLNEMPSTVLKNPVEILRSADFRSVLRIPGPIALTVMRPEDLLYLKFEFRNMTLQVAPGQIPQLVRLAGTAAQLVVSFPPQHVAEEAFYENSPEKPNFPHPVKALLAGWSQLVFEIPPQINVIPYTLPALLDWSQFQQVTAPVAVTPPPPPSQGRTKARRHFSALPPDTRPQSALQDRPTHQPHWQEVRHSGLLFDRAYTMLTRTRPQAIPVADFKAKPLQQIQSDTLQQNRPGAIQQNRSDIYDPSRSHMFLTPMPPKREELRNYTAIEAPFRLFLSPSPMAGWRHETDEKPVVRNSRHELWHTRLGVRSQGADGRWFVDETNDWNRTLRAIWSPDYTYPVVYDKPSPQNPFRTSLDARDRHELVELMANGERDGWQSRVARADQFMMTALGAWMKLRYAAPRIPCAPPQIPCIDLIEWQHIATMGRDQYVKVVREGYLFPFGHKAVLITITERKFETVSTALGESRIFALLKQREFIVVREPVRSYVGKETEHFPSQGRSFPYDQVRLTTLVTPVLDPRPTVRIGRVTAPSWFLPIVSGQPVRFHMIALDRDGRSSEFEMPLIFVSASAAEEPTSIPMLLDINRAYAPLSTTTLGGQSIAYADPTRGEDTVLHTVSQTFNAEMPQPPIKLGIGHPLFFPVMVKAEVHIPAVQQITGGNLPITIRYAEPYVQFEWDPVRNKGEIFAELVGPDLKPSTVALGFPPDKVGGLASPNIDICGLSRKTGPVGGSLQAAAAGQFNPDSFFKKAKDLNNPQQLLDQAQILGGIFLGDIITFVPGTIPPSFVTEILPSDGPDTIKLVQTSYRLEVLNLKSNPLIIFNPPPPMPGIPPARLTIMSSIVTRVPKPGTALREPELSSFGRLTNFQINLFTVLILTFKELRFTKQPGKKLEVTADLADDPLTFGGPLQFVNSLRKFIPSQGFKDPPSLDISPSGITAGFSLAIPNIAIGVFSLENVTLGAALTIPFTNTPVSVRFAFSTRKDPFNVIVSLFGGGGFFGIELDTRGIRSLEAAIEFGGKISLNLVIAQGVVCVMAGIYFKVSRTDNGQQKVELEGYVRASGAMTVLGLLTVSVEFKVMLGYIGNGTVYGRATLVVKVEIAFFSKSVELEFEKRFQGSSESAALPLDSLVRPVSYARPHRTLFTPGTGPGGRPAKIADLVSAEDWNRYAAAFA